MLVGSSRVELLAALGEETPVGKFLADRGPGMHHVAYEVEDVLVELGRLSAEGAELIDEEPRQGLFGLQVAFVHPDAVHGVLTEVVSVGWNPIRPRRARLRRRARPLGARDRQGADELERALATEAGGTLMLDSNDGRYTIVLARVVYMKRYATAVAGRIRDLGSRAPSLG